VRSRPNVPVSGGIEPPLLAGATMVAGPMGPGDDERIANYVSERTPIGHAHHPERCDCPLCSLPSLTNSGRCVYCNKPLDAHGGVMGGKPECVPPEGTE
jgi:hypothetical protein